MKYTEVFLKRFTTGENATQLRQTLGLSLEEVEFMIAEIDGTNEVQVAVKNDVDAVEDSFALVVTAPVCEEFDALKFLFYGVNNSVYGVTAAIVAITPEGDADNLDQTIQIVFTPTP